MDGEAVSYRPGQGVVWHAANQAGDPLISADHVRVVRNLLRTAVEERSPERVRQALAMLETALGPDVAPLPRLELVDDRG